MSEQALAQKPEAVLFLAGQLLRQTQYEDLDKYPQRAIRPEIEEICPGDVACLFRVSELVCNKDEGSLQGLTTVLNALHACGATCLMLLQCVEGRSELYLGAVNKRRYQNPSYLNTIRDILSTGLEGNLPGTELKEVVRRSEIESKMRECLDNGFESQCITAVSCVASEAKAGESVSGIEKLLGAVGRKNFSLLVLADPVDTKQLRVIRQGYEELGTQLSELASVNLSLQSSVNVTESQNYAKTLTQSVGESISHTQSHTVTNGWSSGSTAQKDAGVGKKLASGAAGLAVAGLTGVPYAGIMAMNTVSSFWGNGSKNEAVSGGGSDAESTAETKNLQNSTAEQAGVGLSRGKTDGYSVQTIRRDYSVQGLLGKLDAYLKWLDRCENYGMFDCCAYVVSASASTNLLVASQYQALLQDEGELSQPAAINTWTQSNGVDAVRAALLHMTHPTAWKEGVEFSPAMLISSKELARQMALPQESVVGVSVMEYAAFGREVVRKSPLRAGSVARVGVVTHMGKPAPNQPVLLDLQSMAAHTFIAGTNGSGKSNTIFKLLEELMQAGIPFMVVEPAKGEYKNIFSEEDGVRVYGSNRSKTPLLRLNPFWFNEDVNVKEHIARLMDVFNASWPMYAAMPSVLNAAIENAYKGCGWNLDTSRCAGRRIFPTVQDVLEALEEKMDSTAFSSEVKGNYVGALSTRLESLCSGIFSDIFSGADLGDRALFESNVLIDLSRAGSSEVSAMIMGLLLIRLREYRMQEGALNHPLRHVTVLEEAHHLLRKTSMAQSEDGSNMMGKAVEMISNAIAEMRSYGDGFIIADQSPGLLDASVLRNTNTKIIMRLPESGDREIAGNTIGLTPKQTYELSRLKTGVCVIYQKDWLEAVLCQVDLARHEERLYHPGQTVDDEDRRRAALLHALLEQEPPDDGERARRVALALESGISGRQRRVLMNTFQAPRVSWRRRQALVSELCPLTMERPLALDQASLAAWVDRIAEANELDRITEADIPMVIAANVRQKADTDESWRQAAQVLCGGLPGEDELRAIRGGALALLCGLAEDAGQPEVWIEELSQGNGADKLLADALRTYMETGTPRRRGEITPYSQIAWAYAGGERAWERAMPCLMKKDASAWDALMGESLSRYVSGDDTLRRELLSLTLQNKGANQAVRNFYYVWLAWSNQDENGGTSAKNEAGSPALAGMV